MLEGILFGFFITKIALVIGDFLYSKLFLRSGSYAEFKYDFFKPYYRFKRIYNGTRSIFN